MKKKTPEKKERFFRLDLEYDGTAYAGWQRQKNGLAVQEVLENSLMKLAKQKIVLIGASRTDSGVHARHQVAAFSIRTANMPAEAFQRGLNTLLPEDIRIIRAAEVPSDFHAIRSAKAKTYRYFFSVGPEQKVFLRNYVWAVPKRLELPAMQAAADLLVGKKDFACFRGSGYSTLTSVRTVRSVKWGQAPLSLLFFEIKADGFLKHMVRNIVGTLYEIGTGKKELSDMERILKSKDRKKAGQTAPPQGLFLWNIEY